jgi:hypothetical protein
MIIKIEVKKSNPVLALATLLNIVAKIRTDMKREITKIECIQYENDKISASYQIEK